MEIIAGWTALLTLLVSLVLLWRFRKGRFAGNHPHCRKCEFDLTGLPQTSVRCPECGSDLRLPKATQIGVRVISAMRVTLTLLMAITSLLVFICYRQQFWQSVIDLEHHPDRFVYLEMNIGPQSLRQAATYELIDRVRRNGISDSLLQSIALDSRDASVMAREVCELRALCIREARSKDLISEAFFQSASDRVMEQSFICRQTLRAGDPLPVGFDLMPIDISHASVFIRATVTDLNVDSAPVAASSLQIYYWWNGGAGGGPAPDGATLIDSRELKKLNLSPGRHTLSGKMTANAEFRCASGKTVAWKRDEQVQRDFVVVDRKTSPAELVIDPAAVSKATRFIKASLNGVEVRVSYTIPIDAASLAGMFTLMDGNRPISSEHILLLPGYSSIFNLPIPAGEKPTHLVYKPDAELTVKRIDCVKIIGTEISIPVQ